MALGLWKKFGYWLWNVSAAVFLPERGIVALPHFFEKCSTIILLAQLGAPRV